VVHPGRAVGRSQRQPIRPCRKRTGAGAKLLLPGVQARAVDQAARQAHRAGRLCPRFTHRTGHGLGLEAHDRPGLTAESGTVLEPGMVFSVEPGVYLPGKFGIRIEDIVVVH